MANQMLTKAQIIELVEAQAKERNIVPVPKVFIDTAWCPERLYVGTIHTSLSSALLILSPELFSARVIRPLLDCVAIAPLGLDHRFEPYLHDSERVSSSFLGQRGTTHGDYRAMSTRIQQIKTIMRMGSKWTDMSEPQKEALELIATKIGRIIEGDPEFKDHWDDLGGYAAKASEFCRKEPASA